MQKRFGWAAAGLAAVTMAAAPASAQSVEQFYKGNRIEFLIGASAGAAYDIWARLLIKHLGKYIPGNPSFLPKNIPGASTMVAVNYMYNQAPRDGSVLGMIGRSMPLQEALGNDAVKFKTAEFGYMGSFETIYHVCAARPDAAAKTATDLQKVEFIAGGTGGGATVSTTPVLLNKLFDMKFKVINGYLSTPEMFLALERNEIQGTCTSLSGIEQAMPGAIASGKLNILMSIEEKPITNVPGIKAPSVYSFVKTEEQRQILDFFNVSSELGWPVGTTPGVPKDRLDALRKAFEMTVKDKDFLAEAKKLGLNVDPSSGEELTRLVTKMINTPKAIIDKTTEIVGKLE
jgi:tripartite-type tricarboxylate transporter receptor subunit TctC